MIRFIFQTLLVVLLGYFSHYIIPYWWGIMAAAALATIIIYGKSLSSFMAGFLGIGVLWFLLAQSLGSANQSLLSEKVAAILGLSTSFQLILITAFVGAIIGGFSALTGSLFVSMFKKVKKSNSPYYE